MRHRFIVGFALSVANGLLWVVIVSAAVQGTGFGIGYAFGVRRIIAVADNDEQDVASASIPTIQQIGFAAGAAAVGIVANAAGFGVDVTVAAARSAVRWIFECFLPFGVVGIVAAWCLTFERSNENRVVHACSGLGRHNSDEHECV